MVRVSEHCSLFLFHRSCERDRGTSAKIRFFAPRFCALNTGLTRDTEGFSIQAIRRRSGVFARVDAESGDLDPVAGSTAIDEISVHMYMPGFDKLLV